jgi:hypothetical protein
MGRLTVRGGLAFATALMVGGALALPLASQAGTPTPATASAATTVPKPPRPHVYSGYVEQITPTSALLKAEINPEGQATAYYFQYGLTVAYGSQTPPAAAGSAIQEGRFTQTVSGLQPDTTYHFRVVASSSAGTTDGEDATFLTKKIPLTLAASVTPSPVVLGSPLSVSGTLSGTGNVGVGVVLQANPFPYGLGFHNITGPVPTGAAGSFSIPIAGLPESTRLRVATVGQPAVYSPVLTEPVTVRVTLHVRPAGRRGYVHLYGTVTPAKTGAKVAFERLDHGRYVVVSGTTIRARGGEVSRFARTIRLRRRGLYRALVQVAYGPQVSGRSRPVLIR